MFKIGILVAVSGFLGTSWIVAEDNPWWPQFRGPNACGVAASGEYVAEFDDETNLIWKTDLPSGISSPCIWNERVFITAFQKQRNVLETICLDRASGDILWRRDAPARTIETVHDISSPANATPATDGNLVYVYFESYGIQAFDFQGNEIWHRELPLLASRFGSGTSPVVAGDLLILNRDDTRGPNPAENDEVEGSVLLAFNAQTGDIVWRTPRPRSRVKYATPVVWQDGEGTNQVLVIASNRLTSYDLATGNEVWFVESLPPQACATPLIYQSNVFVTATGMFGEPESFVELPDFDELLLKYDGNGDSQLSEKEIPDDLLIVDRHASNGAGNSPVKQFYRRIDRNTDDIVSQQEWAQFKDSFGNFIKNIKPGVFAIKLGGQGNVTEENILWQNQRGVTEVPSLLAYLDRLYLVRNGGIVHCRDMKTGQDLFTGRLGSIGGYYASPVAGDGKIYFASDRGTVTVIDGRSTDLNVIAQNQMNEPIMATPALVDSVIYIRTASSLYAFGKK